jgi:hypothetical protein
MLAGTLPRHLLGAHRKFQATFMARTGCKFPRPETVMPSVLCDSLFGFGVGVVR